MFSGINVRKVGLIAALLILTSTLRSQEGPTIEADSFDSPKKERYSLVKVWDENLDEMALAVWDAQTEETLLLDGGPEARITDFEIDEPKNKAKFVIDGDSVSLKDPFSKANQESDPRREKIGKKLAGRQLAASRSAKLSPESLGAVLEATEAISRREGGRKDKKKLKGKEAKK